MRVIIKGRCDRVRVNNGITEAFFTGQRVTEPVSQEESVLINVKTPRQQFERDKHYLIEIQPVLGGN